MVSFLRQSRKNETVLTIGLAILIFERKRLISDFIARGAVEKYFKYLRLVLLEISLKATLFLYKVCCKGGGLLRGLHKVLTKISLCAIINTYSNATPARES